MEELFICNCDYQTDCHFGRYLHWLSISFSLNLVLLGKPGIWYWRTLSDHRGVTPGDPWWSWVTLGDPCMILGDPGWPWVTQGDPRITQGWPWLTLGWPHVTLADPWVAPLWPLGDPGWTPGDAMVTIGDFWWPQVTPGNPGWPQVTLGDPGWFRVSLAYQQVASRWPQGHLGSPGCHLGAPPGSPGGHPRATMGSPGATQDCENKMAINCQVYLRSWKWRHFVFSNFQSWRK